MQRDNKEQTEQWLKVSAHVLMEDLEQLQPRILEIYKNKPGMCCYATDLARLRMTGSSMESRLLQILDAKTVDSIDRIVQRNTHDHPARRALFFLADLMKKDLERRLQPLH